MDSQTPVKTLPFVAVGKKDDPILRCVHTDRDRNLYRDIIVWRFSYCTETDTQNRLLLGSVLFYQSRSLSWYRFRCRSLSV